MWSGSSGMGTDYFFIAGAQRSGTSYLWRRLNTHPDIDMARPLRPEPKYFLDPAMWRDGADAYVRRFFSGRSALLRGEKSTSYMQRPEVAERILEVFPDARIVFSLRDPVQRAISNYWFSVRNGLESASLEQAIEDEERRSGDYDRERVSSSPFAYKARGRYEELLRAWEAVFPVDRIHLVLYERVVEADDEIRRLLEFLGVAAGTLPLRAAVPVPRRVQYPEPSAEVRRRLTDHFQEPSRRLAERWDLDLSCWPSFVDQTSAGCV